MTIEQLKTYGADVEDGLARCMNMESFYLQLVGSALEEDRFDELGAAIGDKDFKKAFEIAHSLKGIYANLALTPLLKPVSEMTELLRAGTDTDYSGFLTDSQNAYAQLKELV